MDCCYLFTPCLRLDSLVKKQAFGCKMVVLDLEDAVHPSAKETARKALADFDFSRLKDMNLSIGLRINPIYSIEGVRDIQLLNRLYTRGQFPVELINVPKVRGGDDMRIYRSHLDQLRPNLKIMPLIETIEAVDEIDAIAMQSDALLFGQADLSAEMYVANTHFLHYARARLCIAAARYGIPAVDTNSFEIKDMNILRDECVMARDAGFAAKAVIHPNQIPTIRDVFQLSEEKRRDLEETIASYDSTGDGFAIRTEKVVAPPFVLHAKRLLAFYEAHGTSNVREAAE